MTYDFVGATPRRAFFSDVTCLINCPAAGEALPVGAGPFKLIAYDPSASYQTCALARNEYYWDDVPEIDLSLIHI